VLRDKLLARMADMGEEPDHQRLAEEILGIRGAPPELARKLVAQALVIEDRRDAWKQTGRRIWQKAPAAPGVYVLRDAAGATLYVGKAANLRRRLQAHFSEQRWRRIKPGMSRVAAAEWTAVGSELEALLREAALIAELRPIVNVQVGAPDLAKREIPSGLVKDVVVILPSIEEDSVELLAARADGRWMMQRTRRNAADLAVHAVRLRRFFRDTSAAATNRARPVHHHPDDRALAPLVFSWLAQRGARTTRLDPHDARSAKELASRLAAALRDDRLFHERLQQC
jgi:predicted GIY-YIG superfamily endonuclease